MADPGFVSGFIGVGIDRLTQQICDYISVAVRCKKELACLKDLLIKIEPIIMQIQQHRQEFNMKKDIKEKKMKASAINEWLRELEALLRQASKMVQQCSISTWDPISRYQTSMKITRLISGINEHLKLSPLVLMAQTQELLADALERINAHMDSGSSTFNASTSHASFSPSASASFPPSASATVKLIDEPLIVGQDKALARLHRLVIDDAEASKIGVLGKGGSGKTLLLKTLFNSQEVRNHFSDGLLFWLTVSQTPSVSSLTNELRRQVAIQKNVNLVENIDEEGAKIWLNQALQQSRRFALFLDDVWEKDAAELLEGLGIVRAVREHQWKSKVIVSSRDRCAVLRMGVADKHRITMEDLVEDDSWTLFVDHAFPYNNNSRNPPSNINVEKAKRVCLKCGGLPLAIKVVGRAMAGITDTQQWEWAAQRLPNSDSLYDCLRLSYDALGNGAFQAQLCFLYLAAAFVEDEIIRPYDVIKLWVAEGLLTRKMLQNHHQSLDDPFEMGRFYLNLLADRCLVEPIIRDVEGRVEFFRVHDTLRDLGVRIAEEEEKFYCRVGGDLTVFNENECAGRTRILLNKNKLSSLPMSFRAPEIYSLLMDGNKDLASIPKRVIGSMISLKVLNLSWTSVHTLPESVGCLKQLGCLRLIGTAIKTLPASVTNLVNLEILDLNRSSIKELPSQLHKLRSLRYLDMERCKDLQFLPCTISGLTSLQYFSVYECTTLWKKCERQRIQKVASINNLASLKHLIRLHLSNNGETVTDGTFESMTQMDTLIIALTRMEGLPSDFSNMSKLRRLYLECAHLVKLDRSFCEFQNMSSLLFDNCSMLEELPRDLHTLRGLRRLEILSCPQLREFPPEFGDEGAFPLLEIFSLVGLDKLEELPILKDGAMPSLQTFTMMECYSVRELPKCYFHLRSLRKIRIYGGSIIMESSPGEEANMRTEVVLMSTEDTKEAKRKYLQARQEIVKSWLYSELWCTEIQIFQKSLDTPFS